MTTVWLALALSFTGIIGIPALALSIRLAIKWTRFEDNQNTLIKDVADLVKDKDKLQVELLTTMREDRRATDRRLRWLEENLWKYGPRPSSLPFRYHSGMHLLPMGSSGLVKSRHG